MGAKDTGGKDTGWALDEPGFLAPGFLVALPGNRVLKYPHLGLPVPPRLGRITLTLVAELSRSPSRPLRAVIRDVAEKTGAGRKGMKRFIAGLDEAGYLLHEAVAPRHTDVAVTATDSPPTDADDQPLVIVTPASLLVEEGSFLWFDHDGLLRARLSADEVLAALSFSSACSVDDGWEHHSGGQTSLARSQFDDLVMELQRAGLLRPTGIGGADTVERTSTAATRTHRGIIKTATAAIVEAHDREMAARPGNRTPVVPIHVQYGVAPTSLGLIFAYAREHDGGRLQQRYDFVPEFLTDEETLPKRAERPSIFLFSNYLWNLEHNLALSALVKSVNPDSITIHGGPSTPKYTQDNEEFFAEHSHVDVTVRGEGELTFTAILDALDPSTPHELDVLGDVAGLSYRTPNGPACTPDADRIADLDTIPSPYLLGLFDPYGAAQAGAIVESNRGCPYGCTFCDWGSATLSRLRKFSLDRVFAELEWCAKNQIDVTSIADANFGVIERDVAIAQKIADLKREYGYPKTVACNYAKNTVNHLRQIIEIWSEVEILAEGVTALQSMDPHTLKVIRRSNIKLDKYNELATEFRRARLPFTAELMMGLPGATPAAFRNDLQQCTDRDVRVRVNPTQLLPNSPMNDPEYRREHGITAKPGEFVTESATFTHDEYLAMDALRKAYNIFENWGVLRFVGRFVRQEVGSREVDFYDRLQHDALADATQWPLVATILRTLGRYMAPPASWSLFIEEVHRYLTTQLGMADDSALATALEVQLSHLPAPDRTFPVTLSLRHDFAAWQDQLLAARENEHRDDWETVVPRLSTYPPAEVRIFDPNDICHTDLGKPMRSLTFALRSWELDSLIARPRLGIVTADEERGAGPKRIPLALA